jgi:hypothetical protein
LFDEPAEVPADKFAPPTGEPGVGWAEPDPPE